MSVVEFDYNALDQVIYASKKMGSSQGVYNSYIRDMNQYLSDSLKEEKLNATEPYGNPFVSDARILIYEKDCYLEDAIENYSNLATDLQSFKNYIIFQDMDVKRRLNSIKSSFFQHRNSLDICFAHVDGLDGFDDDFLKKLLDLSNDYKTELTYEMDMVNEEILWWFKTGGGRYKTRYTESDTRSLRSTNVGDGNQSMLLYGSTHSIDPIFPLEVLTNNLLGAYERYFNECKEKNESGLHLGELQMLLTDPGSVLGDDWDGEQIIIEDMTDQIDAYVLEIERHYDIYLYNPFHNSDIDKALFYWDFYQHFRNSGEYNIKEEDQWERAFGDSRPNYILYHGQVMDPATLGNVIYGYIGSKYIPKVILFGAGGFLQVKNRYIPDVIFFPVLPYFGDMDEDREAIELGITWREEGMPND